MSPTAAPDRAVVRVRAAIPTLGQVRASAARAGVPIAATVLGCVLALALVLAAGAPLGGALDSLWTGTVATPFALGTSLNAVALLALVGGGFLIAARAGLINVGGEGQINVGGLAAAAIALHGAASLPGPLAVLVPLMFAAAGGGAWGALAGALKAWRDTSEVITTLLLNFVAVGIVSLAVHEQSLLRQPATSSATLPNSAPLPDAAHLPLLGLGQGSPGTIAVLIALVVLAGLWVVTRRGAFGLRCQAVALGPEAARRLGIAVGRTQVAALAISGACGGLAGGVLVMTVPFVLQDGFTSGIGFDGLVVGLLARGSVAGVVYGAAVFGLLRTGGVALAVGVSVPDSVVLVAQAAIAIAIASTGKRR